MYYPLLPSVVIIFFLGIMILALLKGCFGGLSLYKNDTLFNCGKQIYTMP